MISVSSCQDTDDELLIQDLDPIALGQQEGFIPGIFFVVLHDNSLSFRKSDRYEDVQIGMRKAAIDIVSRYNIAEDKVDRVYGNLITGFSVELSNLQLEAIERDPMVKYIEQDGYVHINVSQSNATWGLTE